MPPNGHIAPPKGLHIGNHAAIDGPTQDSNTQSKGPSRSNRAPHPVSEGVKDFGRKEQRALSAPFLGASWRPVHTVAECQFGKNIIITFDRNKIQTSNWYNFVSLVKAIWMTNALTDKIVTLIRGIFKFATSLYELKWPFRVTYAKLHRGHQQ